MSSACPSPCVVQSSCGVSFDRTATTNTSFSTTSSVHNTTQHNTGNAHTQCSSPHPAPPIPLTRPPPPLPCPPSVSIHPLPDVDCLKLLISKLLGYAIITGALIVKLPQILKLLSSRRATSIAPSMFVIETLGYTISCAYNSRMGYPFSTYGESVFLLLQGYILVFLVFKYNNQLNTTFWAATAGYVAFAYSVVFLASSSQLATLQSLSIPLFAFSRVPQIYTNWREKSTGQLAFITTALNALGSIARVYTTVQEVGDPIMYVGVSVSTLLNGILLLQMLWYWNNSSTGGAVKGSTSGTKAGKSGGKKVD